MFLSLKIFEMMDAKARQDCIKEIDLLKVRIFTINFSPFEKNSFQVVNRHELFVANNAHRAHTVILNALCFLLQSRMAA